MPPCVSSLLVSVSWLNADLLSCICGFWCFCWLLPGGKFVMLFVPAVFLELHLSWLIRFRSEKGMQKQNENG